MSHEPERKQGPDVGVAACDGKVVLIVPGQTPYPPVGRSKDVLGSTALPETYGGVVRRDVPVPEEACRRKDGGK